MIYEYITVSGTERIEISEEWYKVLLELDRKEQNNNHTETRRHSTLNNDIDDCEWLAVDDPNIGFLLGEKENNNVERLRATYRYLSKPQQKLLKDLFENGLTEEQIARKEGVTQQAISCRLRKIFKKIEKFF